jgi:hypothetical protein
MTNFGILVRYTHMGPHKFEASTAIFAVKFFLMSRIFFKEISSSFDILQYELWSGKLTPGIPGPF